ncbi:hypothetical protein EVG20_g9423 [Dentipellis fragilis]|uniref:Extracellular membrane protein CFEM domain-containing protein n=1 Tax=Dentipellis fragilis TaxID=205917 RepID=A0A4Y9Y0P8_9AGAM|nr:hypothetical protein EVG20_g9423 [Dentipellis fragilis]
MLPACVLALLLASVEVGSPTRVHGHRTFRQPAPRTPRARDATGLRPDHAPRLSQHPHTPHASPEAILIRPRQCQPICTTPIVTINTCLTLACDCNKQVTDPLVKCVDCVVSLSPTPAHQEEGQAYLTVEVVTICRGGGFNVGPLNVVVSNVAAPSGSAASAAANSTIDIPVFSAPGSTGAAVVPPAPTPAPSSSSNGNDGNSGDNGPLGGAGAAGGKVQRSRCTRAGARS